MERAKREMDELRKAGRADEAASMERRMAERRFAELNARGAGKREGGEERVLHLLQAIEHVRAAGLPEVAEHLEQIAQKLTAGGSREGGSAASENEQLKHAIQDLQAGSRVCTPRCSNSAATRRIPRAGEEKRALNPLPLLRRQLDDLEPVFLERHQHIDESLEGDRLHDVAVHTEIVAAVMSSSDFEVVRTTTGIVRRSGSCLISFKPPAHLCGACSNRAGSGRARRFRRG
jgi:hypothetical protein